MTTPVDPRIGAKLYQMLPEVYRARDPDGDLARYLDACGELLDRVYATLCRKLDDHFPGTCQEWLIPYFADFLDVALKSPEPTSRRKEIDNAIAWRKRKGTAACTEEIAEAVGAMEVELQEGWRRVARTARAGERLLPPTLLGVARAPDTRDPLSAARHPDLPVVTVDLRRHSRAMRASAPGLTTRLTSFPGEAAPVLWQQANPHGAPCFPGSYEDRSVRTVDVRAPDWRRGHFHPKRLLAFVPVPEGFFPAGQAKFHWDGTNLQQPGPPELLGRNDETVSEHGKTVQRTTFFAKTEAPVRIDGPITLEAAEGEERVFRFEGFYLAHTLTVKSGALELERCAAFKLVVQTHASHATVLSALDCLLRHVQAASGRVQLECCTVLAKTVCESIQGIDCLFLGDLRRGLDAAAPPPKILCLRYVRVPAGLSEAVSDDEAKLIQQATEEVPVFYRLGFGAAGAGVLHPASPASLRAGAEDGGELGAYHHLHLSLRWDAVHDKLAEFLPLGMEAALIPDARLGCAPPK